MHLQDFKEDIKYDIALGLDQHKSRASISVKVSFELVEGKSIHD
jgi:hypothetical protein